MAWTDNGCNVETGKQTTSSILFSRAGSATVRQVELDEVMEVRGLTDTAGKSKVPSIANIVDNTTQTTYYAFIDGIVFSINVITGSKQEWGAARKDESGQWVATKHTKTYGAKGLDAQVWGTTPLDADGTPITLSTSGATRIVSREKSASLVRKFSAMQLISTVETISKECKYVSTEAAAAAIVSSNTATSGTQIVTTYVDAPNGVLPGPFDSFTIPYGTEKFASARYVSVKEGWTVIMTEKVYDFVRGQGWHT